MNLNYEKDLRAIVHTLCWSWITAFILAIPKLIDITLQIII